MMALMHCTVLALLTALSAADPDTSAGIGLPLVCYSGIGGGVKVDNFPALQTAPVWFQPGVQAACRKYMYNGIQYYAPFEFSQCYNASMISVEITNESCCKTNLCNEPPDNEKEAGGLTCYRSDGKGGYFTDFNIPFAGSGPLRCASYVSKETGTTLYVGPWPEQSCTMSDEQISNVKCCDTDLCNKPETASIGDKFAVRQQLARPTFASSTVGVIVFLLSFIALGSACVVRRGLLRQQAVTHSKLMNQGDEST